MKNFEMLSRAQMRNVMGGNMCQQGEFRCSDGRCIDQSRRMDGIMDCPDGSDEQDQQLVCDITPRSTPGCGTGATITFPSGTTMEQALDWCSNQPCCESLSC